MPTEHVIKDGVLLSTYYSLNEYAEAAERAGLAFWHGQTADHKNETFYGVSLADAVDMCRAGWTDKLDETLELAESAVRLIEADHEIPSFASRMDVAGSDVDVARFCDGDPENMIAYELVPTSKAGKVVTLCAGISRSASMKQATVERRGMVVVALAEALSRLGHGVELWAEWHNGGKRPAARIRVLVKGVDDVLDPARVMYAYAHVSMSRRLAFALSAKFPGKYQRLSGHSGAPLAPVEDLPEGTIYLPQLAGKHDIPDAHEALKSYLGDLGLLVDA